MPVARIRLLSLLVALSSGAALATPADDAFTALTTREWAWGLKDSPQSATSVDVHDYDDQLGHVDEASQKARLAHLGDVQKQLGGIDSKALSPEQQVNFTIYKAQIDNSVADLRLHLYEMPMTSDSSFYADLAFLPKAHPFNSVHDYDNYLKRLGGIPQYFDEYTSLLKQGLKAGRTLPRVVLTGRDKPMRDVAELKDPKDSAFYAPFKTIPATFPAADAERLKREGERVIKDAVIPAYAKLMKYFVNDYVPHSRQNIAATSLPNGKEFYQQQIREYTTVDMTPQQIHDLGLSEVKRIHAEMETVMHEAKFEGDFAAFLKFLRTDPQFYAKTPDELLMRARDIAKRIDGKLPAYFGHLPRLPYGVEPVPEAIAPFYTSGRYVPAAIGGKESGTYWVNTYDLPSRPLYALPSLTLHEAVPGHHLQGALAGEQGEQPNFRRYSYISAYGEGWGLYSEHLGVEMGIYRTPYEHFGRLTYEMWRACRLVVDTGMHAMGWSRDQALAFLRDNTALSEHEITTEVDRYISWPGQALSYKLGELKIRELRAKAEKQLGEKFDLRAFHDAVLSLGSVPLPLLEQHIDAWIAAGGK